MAEATVPAPGGPARGRVAWQDVPASLVVFMVALPLCLAVAKASGVPAEAGLITGIVGGLLVGLIAGSPLQVSGPAAGLLVLVGGIVESRTKAHDLDHAVAFLGAVTVAAGLIQFAAGLASVGRWFRAVSPAVIVGMLAGIGVIILSKQLHEMFDSAHYAIQAARAAEAGGESADGLRFKTLSDLCHLPGAVYRDVVTVGDKHRWAALVGSVTLAVLVGWSLLVKRLPAAKAVPAALVAVTAATALAWWLVPAVAGLPADSQPLERVEFGSLVAACRRDFFTRIPPMLLTGAVWQSAVAVALIASAETLLCASAVDAMHAGPRTRFNRELAAQGVGNVVCGLVGGIPMTGVIVRSSANVQAGARTRASAVLHGAWLLAFVLLLPGVLRLIPTAALAALLVLTGFKLIEWKEIRRVWRQSKAEALICLAVVAAIVVTDDLLAGVLLGVGLSVAKLAHAFSKLRISAETDAGGARTTLMLAGSATFLRLPKLAEALEKVPAGHTLHVHIEELTYIDHACLELLTAWRKRHEATGGRLVLDWGDLRARFDRPQPRPGPKSSVILERPADPAPPGGTAASA